VGLKHYTPTTLSLCMAQSATLTQHACACRCTTGRKGGLAPAAQRCHSRWSPHQVTATVGGRGRERQDGSVTPARAARLPPPTPTTSRSVNSQLETVPHQSCFCSMSNVWLAHSPPTHTPADFVPVWRPEIPPTSCGRPSLTTRPSN
jgi:hypothetical protein